MHSSFQITGSHERGGQVDVAVDEVQLQPDGVPVVLESLGQLPPLLVHVAQVRVRLGQHGVLLDGQHAEVGRFVHPAALEVDGAEEQQDAGVGRVLLPQLHAVPLCIVVVARLVFPVRQLRQTWQEKNSCFSRQIQSEMGWKR